MSNADRVRLRPFDYELPQAPQAIVNSWVTRLQAVAIVTALLAQIEAGLVGGMEAVDPETARDVAARFFGYSGLILNLGATLSAVLLLLAISSVPTTARRLYMSCRHGYPRKLFEYQNAQQEPASSANEHETHDYQYLKYAPSPSQDASDLGADIQRFNESLFKGNTEQTILDTFGIATGWGLMLRHCILCFLCGCIATFVHVGLLLWTSETTVVAAILMPVVFLGFVPPVMVYLRGMDGKQCPHCAAERADARMTSVHVTARVSATQSSFKTVLKT